MNILRPRKREKRPFLNSQGRFYAMVVRYANGKRQLNKKQEGNRGDQLLFSN